MPHDKLAQQDSGDRYGPDILTMHHPRSENRAELYGRGGFVEHNSVGDAIQHIGRNRTHAGHRRRYPTCVTDKHRGDEPTNDYRRRHQDEKAGSHRQRPVDTHAVKAPFRAHATLQSAEHRR